MIGIIFDIEFTWGFQSKVVGYSKTSPSFYYPPPTTILGAIAEQLAKENKISEKKGKEIIPKLAGNMLALGIRPVNCVPVKFSDINRLIAIRRTGKGEYPNPRDLYGSFDAPAQGKTLMTTLNDEPPKLRIFIIFRKNTIELDRNNEITLDANIFWGIHRLGTKESIVSVVYVDIFQPTEEHPKESKTQYSFPLIENIKPIDYVEPKWVLETLVNPFNLRAYDENENPVIDYLMGKNLVKYNLPILIDMDTPPSYIVELSNKSCIYSKNGEKVVGLCQK